MKRLLSVLLILCLAVCFAACGKDGDAQSVTQIPSESEKEHYSPLLWRVTDDQGTVLYLFGTIHVGDERSDRVLEQLQPTLSQCQALAVEFDTVAYEKDLNAQIGQMTAFVYRDGTRISDHIPADLYNKLVDVLTSAGLYNPLFDYYKPSMWQLLSAAMIAQSSLSADKAMDILLIKDAYQAKRDVLEVESAAFQMEMLGSVSEEFYVLSMESDVQNTDAYKEGLGALFDAWLRGEEEELTDLALSDNTPQDDLTEREKELVEEFTKKTLTDRNVRMASKAEEYLQSGKTTFFAVGTAHFLGENGIVRLLMKDGFSVERVDL